MNPSAFLINMLVDAVVLYLLFYIAFILRKKDLGLRNQFYVLAFFYFMSLLLNSALLSGRMFANTSELLLIESFFLLGKTTIIVSALSIIIDKKKMLYLIGLYIFSALAIRLEFNDFFSMLNIISFLLMLIVFVYVHHKKKKFLRRGAFFGMIFAAASLLLVFLFYGRRDLLAIIYLVPNVFLFGTFYYLIRYFKSEEVDFYRLPKRYNMPLYAKFMVGLRLLAIVIITFTFILISVVSLHELGHAGVGKILGCRITKAVLYDGINMPHTEVVCQDDSNNLLIGSAGIFIPLTIGLGFLLLGEKSTLGISYLIIGFSFYLSSRDLFDILPSNALGFVVSVIGLMFLILGIKEILFYAYDEENIKHGLS